MMDALGWNEERTCVRRFKGGASLAISAPIDALYAATDVNDWPFDAACDTGEGRPEPEIGHDAQRLAEIIRSERNPGLITLRDAAMARNKPILIDTEDVSIGMGRCSRTWPLDDLPKANEVAWDELDRHSRRAHHRDQRQDHFDSTVGKHRPGCGFHGGPELHRLDRRRRHHTGRGRLFRARRGTHGPARSECRSCRSGNRTRRPAQTRAGRYPCKFSIDHQCGRRPPR